MSPYGVYTLLALLCLTLLGVLVIPKFFRNKEDNLRGRRHSERDSSDLDSSGFGDTISRRDFYYPAEVPVTESLLEGDSTHRGLFNNYVKRVPSRIRETLLAYKNSKEAGAISTVRNYLAVLMCLVPTHAYLAYWYAFENKNAPVSLSLLGQKTELQIDMFLVSVILLAACAVSLRKNKYHQIVAFAVSSVYLVAGLWLSYLDVVSMAKPSGTVFYVILAVIALSYQAPPSITVPLFSTVYSTIVAGSVILKNSEVDAYFARSLLEIFLSAPLAMLVSAFTWHSFVVKDVIANKLKELNRVLVKQRDSLEKLTELDDVTGLYNRRSFWKVCNRDYLKSARLAEGASGLIIMSIDGFKDLNDTHGHVVGDKILRKVARVLSSKLRSIDVSGRLGGAEFGVFLSETTEQGCIKVAGDIRESIAKYLMVFSETERNPRLAISVTVSLGLALGKSNNPGRKGPSLESLREHAIAALYEAQHPGSNTLKLAILKYN